MNQENSMNKYIPDNMDVIKFGFFNEGKLELVCLAIAPNGYTNKKEAVKEFVNMWHVLPKDFDVEGFMGKKLKKKNKYIQKKHIHC